MSDDPVGNVRSRLRRFRHWRRQRPFLGGSLLICAGLATSYLPAAYDEFLLVATGSFTGPALLLGTSMVLCGVGILAVPALSAVGGGLGMLLSTMTILGALGGFGVGALLGGLGSVLAFGWSPPDDGGAAGEDAAGT